MRRRKPTGSSKKATVSVTKLSQCCQKARKTQEQARRGGSKEAEIAKSLSYKDCFAGRYTNPPSPTGPTTRPPKSTPSRAARHCTWSSLSAAVAREHASQTHIRTTKREQDTVTGNRSASASGAIHVGATPATSKGTQAILRAKGLATNDREHGVGWHSDVFL